MDTSSGSPQVPARGLSVRRVALESLRADPANARLHGERNLDAIVASLHRFGQAELLKRVFAIDALTCPWCGSPRKLIALLTDGLVVRQILAHLDLPTEPLPLAPARAPPEPAFDW